MHNTRPLVLIGGLILILVGIIFGLVFINRANQPKISGIAGTLHLNGPIPSDASVSIAAKPFAQQGGTYQVFANNQPANDDLPWYFAEAVSGTTYEIQAYLRQGGQTIATSDPIQVSAPAQGETLEINYVTAAAPTSNATLSGAIIVSGYIPPDSTLTVQGRKSGSGDFVTVVSGQAARASQYFNYTTAINGQLYDVRASLISATGQPIGQSSVITLAAPTDNIRIQINSTAPAPSAAPSATPTNSTVSGTIDLNGTIPSNSSVVVLARPTGTQNFNVVQNGIQPVDQTSWQWTGAQYGQSYDFQAVLKQQNSNGTQTDIATSNMITTAAPATNQVLIINANYTLNGPPNGGISVNCGTHNGSSNSWGATISFNSVPNAQSYWFQIGTTSGGSDLVNTQQAAANSPTQTVNANFLDSITYYARYAYAYMPNPQWNQFSLFSNVTSFMCQS